MKYLVILITLTSSLVFGDEGIEIPKALVDSKIVTTLKSGKTYSFDGNEYMVVKRHPKKKVELAPVAVTASSSASDKAEPKKNRVRLVGGVGPGGVNVLTGASSVKINTSFEGLAVVGYDRLLNKILSVNAQALTNGTYTLGVGFDF